MSNHGPVPEEILLIFLCQPHRPPLQVQICRPLCKIARTGTTITGTLASSWSWPVISSKTAAVLASAIFLHKYFHDSVVLCKLIFKSSHEQNRAAKCCSSTPSNNHHQSSSIWLFSWVIFSTGPCGQRDLTIPLVTVIARLCIQCYHPYLLLTRTFAPLDHPAFFSRKLSGNLVFVSHKLFTTKLKHFYQEFGSHLTSYLPS